MLNESDRIEWCWWWGVFNMHTDLESEFLTSPGGLF